MTIAQKNLTPQGWRLVHPARFSDTLKRAPSESVAASGSHEPVSSRLFTAAKNTPYRECFFGALGELYYQVQHLTKK